MSTISVHPRVSWQKWLGLRLRLSQRPTYASSELLVRIYSLLHGYQTQARYGGILVKTCAAFKGAETEVNERVLCVESHWKRTTLQLDFIKRIWKDLDDEHQQIQSQILQVLINKMINLNTKFEKLHKKENDKQKTGHRVTDIKRWKYALIKESLDESIEKLSSWQKMFDPSWFLILKVSGFLIDRELGKTRSADSSIKSACSLRDALREQPLEKVHVFLPEDALQTARMREVPFASAKCMQKAGSEHWDVVDCIPCNPHAEISQVTKDVRELATKLHSVEPLTFGILQCRGVVRITEPSSRRTSSFDFIFKIPRELSSEPKSLRSYLLPSPNHTLTDRFQLAGQLAKSISYVHTLGFVHKNIRPETVLGFSSRESRFDLFFLVGFEKIRMADRRTLKFGDSDWEKNLYRHPDRQGMNPEEVYNMQHDIYSLGVCLLEIGLWESFLSYENGSAAPLPGAALGLTSNCPELIQPTMMKEHLVALAKRDLAKRMGERYEKVVLNCLTCLDDDNPDFGDQSEFEDPDGVLVGVKYIEKVFITHASHLVELALTTNLDTYEAGRNSSMKLFCRLSYDCWMPELNCGLLIRLQNLPS